VFPVEAVRAAEDELRRQLPAGALMRRAAQGLAVHCGRMLGRLYGARVVLLVGSGDNGGDTLIAGALLARRGARVTALLLSPDKVHPDGLAMLRRAGGRAVPVRTVADVDAGTIAGADLVLDGIVGIGGRGGLRKPAAAAVAAARDVRIVAVDIPSGVDADTGAVGAPAVRADVTVTFGALKPGLVVGPGVDQAGQVQLVDIGLGPVLPEPTLRVLEHADVAALLPMPGAADDKYTRGVLGIVAGSEQYPGAGVLATGAALRGGAGMVRYLGLAQDEIRARYPEVVGHPDTRPSDVRVQAHVVGPGLGTGDEAYALLSDALTTDVPVLIDADGITVLARDPALVSRRSAPTVLTPHDREFARIAGGIGNDRVAAARRAAAELNATVLLKGNATVIADPDGSAWVNPTGTPWLGTAGSGDVLSGLIGSLLAAGLPPGSAAAVGAYVHGVAGQIAAASGPPTSLDVLEALRPALLRLARG
jgi:hydroxyethylthiazole kinase-like uncharacterized protein yjeF